MSPTVLRYKNYSFRFFSKEESRAHVHVSSPGGDAKFWLEPTVALGSRYGLPDRKLRELQRIIEEHQDEIIRAWKKHFKGHFQS